MRTSFFLAIVAGLAAAAAQAHDTWVQVSAPLVRVDDLVHVDLMLGNHGNGHRDFKLASKITLAPCTLGVRLPDGKTHDLKPDLADLGYAPKEGFWSARFVPGAAGLHTVVHTLDTLHLTTRAIKSGKSYFLASESLDRPAASGVKFDQPLGHPLELVPLADPALAAPGKPIRLAVIYRGQPLAGARVSFIPRGAALKEEFDPEFERESNARGEVEYTPREGNFILAVIHRAEPEERGEGYDRTHYSATLTLNVPQRCACCAAP